jgi:predicted HAD superfamily Cof-like phosphohydrolase
MLKTQKLTHDMMVALNLHLPNEDGPSLEGVQKINFKLLKSLVEEERVEFYNAMQRLQNASHLIDDSGTLVWVRAEKKKALEEAWAEVIDAMCDIIVVVHNTSTAMGIDLEPFFDEVHRTNMLKADGPLRADGKRLKPPDWQPPRILEMLRELLEKKNV